MAWSRLPEVPRLLNPLSRLSPWTLPNPSETVILKDRPTLGRRQKATPRALVPPSKAPIRLHLPKMASLPFTSLSASDQGLFTPEELRSLMEKELSRSRRYGYEVVMLSVGVDRIASLGDIYGHESKGHVIEEITRLLAASTRSCDFLGCLLGDRILALFPHTGEAGAKAIANRLLDATRELEFSAGGPEVSVTVTVGIASPNSSEEHELELLVDEATRACQIGQDAGGDRWHLREPAPQADLERGQPL